MTDPSEIVVPENWICLGKVADAHGIQGELKLQSYTQDPRQIGAYGPLKLIGCADVLTIIKLRAQKGDLLVARIKEVVDRDTAELLRGQLLYVEKTKLPKIQDDDDVYVSDLEGLSLYNTNEKKLGSVERVHNFGAGDILELVLDGHKETIMVPFLKAWVLKVNIEEKNLVIDQVYLDEFLKPFKQSDEKWTESKKGKK